MRNISLTSLTWVLAGCVGGPEIVMLGPPGQKYDPVATEDVWIFSGMDRVRTKYRPIAEISIKVGTWAEGGSALEELVQELRREAGMLGAHGVVLGEMESQSKAGGFTLPIPSGVATAIRFLEPDLVEAAHPARSPGEMSALAVAPIAAPENVQVPDSIVAAFSQDIHGMLTSAGYFPLPPGVYESVWAEILDEPEDLAHPIVSLKGAGGEVSEERRILNNLIEEHGADGFLFPDIEGVEALFEGDKAEWDGVEQKVGETRSTKDKIVSGILNAFIFGEQDSFEGEPPPQGSVWALSLVVRVENTIGAEVYRGRGGLELLETADFVGGIWLGDPEPEEYEILVVPDEELFQRRNRIRRSVRIALSDLRRGG